MSNYIIKTERLGLRNWQTKDISLAGKMNANKYVMEFFPNTWSQKQTEDFIQRMKKHFRRHGFCYFAAERLDTKEFIGFIGLMNQTYKTPFAPFVDIGWRLTPEAWKNGFATEGAKACLDFAFSRLNLDKVYAIAPELNIKSQHIMRKIGMRKHIHFEHPKLAVDEPLKKCVVYEISADKVL